MKGEKEGWTLLQGMPDRAISWAWRDSLREPPGAESSPLNRVLVSVDGGGRRGNRRVKISNVSSVLKFPRYYSHWMPLPTAPGR